MLKKLEKQVMSQEAKEARCWLLRLSSTDSTEVQELEEEDLRS